MLRIASIERREIDHWNVETSGLNGRVARVLKQRKIITIGRARALSRAGLSRLPGIGSACTAELNSFLDSCRDLEQGKLSFAAFECLLRSILSPAQYEILQARYGLKRGSKPQSLSTVGNHSKMSRERIRQVEAAAIAALRSDFARACMGGLYTTLENTLSKNKGAVTMGAAASGKDFEFGDLEPTAALRLLCKCTDRFSCNGETICALDDACSAKVRKELLRLLRRQLAPLAAESCRRLVSPLMKGFPQDFTLRIVQFFLEDCIGVSVVDDGRYFIFEKGGAGLLAEIIQNESAPVHYRQITREFNSRVRVADRKGPGHILDILNGSPQFARESSGCYVLKPTEQAQRMTS